MSEPSTAGADSFDMTRKDRRIRVRLPVEVRGTDRNGTRFDERTICEDVCRQGVALALSREVEVGTSLEISILLSLQAPQGQRDFATQGLVRHVTKGDSGFVFGIEFTGPHFHRVFHSETTHT